MNIWEEILACKLRIEAETRLKDEMIESVLHTRQKEKEEGKMADEKVITHEQKMKAIADSITHWADNLAAEVKADALGAELKTDSTGRYIVTADHEYISYISARKCPLCTLYYRAFIGECGKCPLVPSGHTRGCGYDSPWRKCRDATTNKEIIESSRNMLFHLIEIEKREMEEEKRKKCEGKARGRMRNVVKAIGDTFGPDEKVTWVKLITYKDEARVIVIDEKGTPIPMGIIAQISNHGLHLTEYFDEANKTCLPKDADGRVKQC